ncbi:uncharacterized [Tachysurus ichikawai]
MSHFCETNRSVRGFVCHLRLFEPKTLELLADHGERWNEKVIAAASGKVALEPAERPLDITRSLPDTLTVSGDSGDTKATNRLRVQLMARRV